MKYICKVKFRKSIFDVDDIITREIDNMHDAIHTLVGMRYDIIHKYQCIVTSTVVEDGDVEFIYDLDITTKSFVRIRMFPMVRYLPTVVVGYSEFRLMNNESMNPPYYHKFKPGDIVEIISNAKYEFGYYTPYAIVSKQPKKTKFDEIYMVYDICAIGYIDSKTEIDVSSDHIPTNGISQSEMKKVRINDVPELYKSKIIELLNKKGN